MLDERSCVREVVQLTTKLKNVVSLAKSDPILRPEILLQADKLRVPVLKSPARSLLIAIFQCASA